MKRKQQAMGVNAYALPRAQFRFAEVLNLDDSKVKVVRDGKPVTGQAIVVQTTASFLDASRKNDGVRYRVGMFSANNGAAIGAIALLAGPELNVVLFDPTAAELRELLEKANGNQPMLVACVGSGGDARMVEVSDSECFSEIVRFSRVALQPSFYALAEAFGNAVAYVFSYEGVAAVARGLRGISTVAAHLVVPGSLMLRVAQPAEIRPMQH